MLMFSGAGLSAAGAYGNSQGSQQAYNAQAQVNKNNEQIAQWQAEDALSRGARSASQVRMKARQLHGTQRTRLAASGIDLAQGSALQILTDTDYFGEIDAATTLDNAAKEAWALRNQARNFASESDLMRSRADAESPFMAAGTTLLTSAGRVAANWYDKPRGK